MRTSPTLLRSCVMGTLLAVVAGAAPAECAPKLVLRASSPPRWRTATLACGASYSFQPLSASALITRLRLTAERVRAGEPKAVFWDGVPDFGDTTALPKDACANNRRAVTIWYQAETRGGVGGGPAYEMVVRASPSPSPAP